VDAIMGQNQSSNEESRILLEGDAIEQSLQLEIIGINGFLEVMTGQLIKNHGR
jgi:hypothetical protein